MKSTSAKTAAPSIKIHIGSGFVLLMALVYFFDNNGIIAAAAPAVAVHELGHIFAMRLFGAYPTALNASVSGFSLDYSGIVSGWQEALTALAGPICGLLFALLCSTLGLYLKSEYFTMCAGLGLILNCFNLLPALPLDGGRALQRLLECIWGAYPAKAMMYCIGVGIAGIICVIGAHLLAGGNGAALLLSGIWLMLLQRNDL